MTTTINETVLVTNPPNINLINTMPPQQSQLFYGGQILLLFITLLLVTIIPFTTATTPTTDNTNIDQIHVELSNANVIYHIPLPIFSNTTDGSEFTLKLLLTSTDPNVNTTPTTLDSAHRSASTTLDIKSLMNSVDTMSIIGQFGYLTTNTSLYQHPHLTLIEKDIESGTFKLKFNNTLTSAPFSGDSALPDDENTSNTKVQLLYFDFKLILTSFPDQSAPFPLYLSFYHTETPSLHLRTWTFEVNTALLPSIGEINGPDGTISTTNNLTVGWLGPSTEPRKDLLPLKGSMVDTADIFYEHKYNDHITTLQANAQFGQSGSTNGSTTPVTGSVFTSITLNGAIIDFDSSLYYTIQIGESVLPLDLTVEMIQCGLIMNPTPEEQLIGIDVLLEKHRMKNLNIDTASSSTLDTTTTVPTPPTPSNTTNTPEKLDNQDPGIENQPEGEEESTTTESGESSESDSNSSSLYLFDQIIINRGHIHLISAPFEKSRNTKITLQCMLPVEFNLQSHYTTLPILHTINTLRDGPVTAVTTHINLPQSHIKSPLASSSPSVLLAAKQPLSPLPIQYAVAQYILTITTPYRTVLTSQPTIDQSVAQPDPVRTNGMTMQEISALQLLYDKQKYKLKKHQIMLQNNHLDSYTLSTVMKEFIHYVNLMSQNNNGGNSNDLSLSECFFSTFPTTYLYYPTLEQALAAQSIEFGNFFAAANDADANSTDNNEKDENGFITITIPISFTIQRQTMIDNLMALMSIINQQSGQQTRYNLERKMQLITSSNNLMNSNTTNIVDAIENTDTDNITAIETHIAPTQYTSDIFKQNKYQFSKDCNAATYINSWINNHNPVPTVPTKNNEIILDQPYHVQFCTEGLPNSPCRVHQDCYTNYHCDDWTNTCQFGKYGIEIVVSSLNRRDQLSMAEKFFAYFFDNSDENQILTDTNIPTNNASIPTFFNFNQIIRSIQYGLGQPESILFALSRQPMIALIIITVIILLEHLIETLIEIFISFVKFTIETTCSLSMYTRVSNISILLHSDYICDTLIILLYNYNSVLSFSSEKLSSLIHTLALFKQTCINHYHSQVSQHLQNIQTLEEMLRTHLSDSTNTGKTLAQCLKYDHFAKHSSYSLYHYYTKIEVTKLTRLSLISIGTMALVVSNLPHFDKLVDIAVT